MSIYSYLKWGKMLKKIEKMRQKRHLKDMKKRSLLCEKKLSYLHIISIYNMKKSV